MTSFTTSIDPDPTTKTTRQLGYGWQIAGSMMAAFTLSVAHTIYSWLANIENPDFTVTSPLTWIFYLVAFGVTALALREQQWAQVVVLVFLAVTLTIGIFYYPTTFEPHQQTVFGWFENDVYLALLVLAGYLGLQRLRGVTLVPRH